MNKNKKILIISIIFVAIFSFFLFVPTKFQIDFSGENKFFNEPRVENVLPGDVLSFEDFQDGALSASDWANMPGDTGDFWSVAQSTPTSDTGPNTGAEGTSYFAYVETSGQASGDHFLILEQEIDFDDYVNLSLDFYHHCYGSACGTLTLQENTTGTWQDLGFSADGAVSDNQSHWLHNNTMINNSLNGSGYLRFEYVQGGQSWGDVAVDQINISYEATNTDYSLNITSPTTDNPLSVTAGENNTFTFNFIFVDSEGNTNVTSEVTINDVFIGTEKADIVTDPLNTTTIDEEDFSSGFGNWQQATFDTDDWSTGTSTATSSTGPQSLYDGNAFAYVETSSGTCVSGDEAVIYRSPEINFDNYDYLNFSFAYYLYGVDIGLLSIRENTSGSWNALFQKGGNQGQEWFEENLKLEDYSGNGSIAVWVECDSPFGDIAVDSLNITGTSGGPQFAFNNETGWEVNVTAPSGLTGLQDLFMNASYQGITRNDTQINAIDYGGDNDTTAPTYSNNNVNNTIINQSTNFSLEVNDDTALETNGQYIFSTNNSGVWVNDSAVNFTSTPETIYSVKDLNDTVGISVGYRWYLTDNESNENNTEIFTLTTTAEQDTTPPTFTTIPADDTITYPNDWSGVDFDATDDVAIDSYFINDSRFTINSTGFLDDVSTLGVDSYSINVSVNDTSGNINSTVYGLTVNQATPSLTLSVTNSTYPENGIINASESNSGDGDLTYNLYIDGVLETSGSDIDLSKDLGAGNYTIVYNTTGGTNYSSASETLTLEISKGILQGSLSGTSPITYGTAGDAEGTESNSGDGDVTYNLYRNGTLVSNPDTTTLSAGTYGYVYNSTGGNNWTSNSSIDTFDLTVNQATPTLNLDANNVTYPNNLSVLANESNSGDGDLTYNLYIDGTLQESGSTINSNFDLAVGTYTLVYNTTGGTNYSSASETIEMEVFTNNEVVYVLFNETSPITYPETFRVYSNATSDFTVLRNGTTVNNNSEQSLSAGTWNFTVIRTDQTNYSDVYSEELFTINKATTNLAVSGTSPITYGTAGDVEGTGCPSQLTCNLYRNGTLVSNPDTAVLSAGTYNYVYNTTGNENYTSDSDSFNLTVNKAGGSVELWLDGARASETVEVNTPVNIEGNLTTGTFGTLNLTIDDAEVNSSSTQNLTHTFQESGIGDYVVNLSYTGNENYTSDSESWTITYEDTSAPSVTMIYPEAIGEYATNTLDLNYSSTDNNGDSCWYSTDDGVSNSSVVVFGINFTNVVGSEGSNTWTVYCNDTSGNLGSDAHTFTIDTTPPYFTSIVNQTHPETDSFSYTPTATDDGVGFDSWSINDTSIFTINSSTGEITNITNLSESYNVYNISINDTLGNTNWTLWSINITAVDNTAPTFTTIPNDESIEYGVEWNGVDFDATDDTSIDSYFINDTNNFIINSTGFLNWTSQLAVGNYYVNVSVNDTSGNINSTIFNLNITKTNPDAELTNSTSLTITYPTETTIGLSENNSGDGDIIYEIFRDGISIGTGETITLGVGSYDYLLNTTGGANYTSNSSLDNFTLTVNQNTDSCNVLFNETSPITYPNTFRVYSDCSSSFTLLRNGSTISNNSEQSLSAGTWNFTVIRDDDINYSNSYDEELFTINKATPTLTKSLNGVDNNLTITYPTNINASTSSDGGIVNIYRNSTNITSENNQNILLGVDFYEYEFNVTGNQNYTDLSSEFLYATINKGQGSGTLYIDHVSSNKTVQINNNVELNGTLDNGTGNISLFVNDTLYEQGPSPLYNISNYTIAGIYPIKLNYSGDENYTSFEELLYLNITSGVVDEEPPIITITNPVENEDENALPVKLAFNTDEQTTCDYNINSQENISISSDNGISYSKDLNLDNGDYTIFVFCNDTLGNQNTTGASVSFTVFELTGDSGDGEIDDIKLDSMTIEYGDWIKDEENFISIRTYDRDDNLIYVDSIEVETINISSMIEKSILRKGVYNASIILFEEVDIVKLNITTIDGEKSLNEIIEIKIKDKTTIDDIKKYAKTIYSPGFLLILCIIILCVILLIVLREKKKV